MLLIKQLVFLLFRLGFSDTSLFPTLRRAVVLSLPWFVSKEFVLVVTFLRCWLSLAQVALIITVRGAFGIYMACALQLRLLLPWPVV